MLQNIILPINWKNPITYYFILLFAYIINGMIGMEPGKSGTSEGGGIINTIISGSIIAFCTLTIIFHNKNKINKKNSIYNAILLLYIYIIVRMIIMYITNLSIEAIAMRNTFTILFWMTSFLFCLQKFRKEEKETISKLSKILIIITVIFYLYSAIKQKAYLQQSDIIGANNVIGSAYMLVPIIWLILKGKIKIYGYLLCLVICALSQKRQCLLGFIIVSIFIMKDFIKLYFKSFKIIAIIFLGIGFIFSQNIINKVFGGLIERQQHLSEKDELADSGRSLLWIAAIDEYTNASFTNIIFGGGPGTSAYYINQTFWYVYPHNGFIEVMCDYGIIGLYLYISIFLKLLKKAFEYPRDSIIRKLLLGITCTWIMSNIVSHAGRIWVIYLAIAVGYIECINNKNFKFKKNKYDNRLYNRSV